MSKPKLIERRKTERFQARGDIYIRPSSNRQNYWKIIDISRGGLSFRYVSKGKKEWDGTDEVDIIKRSASRETLYSVRKIPFKSVSDFEIVKEPVSNFEIRRCGIQFENEKLTDYQISRLRTFF